MTRFAERAAYLRSLPRLPSLPSRSELLDVVGLEARRSRGRSVGEAATVFLLGVLAGGLLALLLAPQSGAELRSRLRADVDALGDTDDDDDLGDGPTRSHG